MNDFDTMSFSNGQAGSSSTGPSGSGDGGASSSSARGSGPSFPALEAGPSPSSPSPTTSKMSSPAKGKHTRTSETSSSLSASALSWPSVRAVTVEEGEHHEQDHNHESGHEHHSDEKDDRFVILVPRNLCGHHSRRCSHLPPLTRKECGCEDNFRLTATACVKPLTVSSAW
jgi:hypothetical protein